MNRAIYIILLSFFFIQCGDDKGKSVSYKDVPGKYIELSAENIHLFVPEKVKMLNHSENIAFINNIEDKRIREMERARYFDMRYSAEGSYIMRSDDMELDVAFMSMPYIEINQSVSQMLLRLLNKRHKAVGNIIGLESSFSRAGIIKKGSGRIFRAIFLYKGIDLLTGKDVQIYTYFYVVNKKGKTFVLSFNSKKAYDFDSYVQKIRL